MESYRTAKGSRQRAVAYLGKLSRRELSGCTVSEAVAIAGCSAAALHQCLRRGKMCLWLQLEHVF